MTIGTSKGERFETEFEYTMKYSTDSTMPLEAPQEPAGAFLEAPRYPPTWADSNMQVAGNKPTIPPPNQFNAPQESPSIIPLADPYENLNPGVGWGKRLKPLSPGKPGKKLGEVEGTEAVGLMPGDSTAYKFPMGIVKQKGWFGDYRMAKSLASEIQDQTIDAQDAIKAMQGFLKKHNVDPKSWNKFIDSLPESTNVQDRQKGMTNLDVWLDYVRQQWMDYFDKPIEGKLPKELGIEDIKK